MMSDSKPRTPPEWVQQLRSRGLGHALGVALDVLEPLGPLGAQLVWVSQPVLGVYLSRDWLDQLAETLETPGGVEQLRQWLEGQDNGG
jgi:hypothetical protein